jgi:hypothetical protein
MSSVSATTLLIPRCCDDWRSGVCGNTQCPVRFPLYAEARAKTPLPYKQRKALLSHWSPRITKAICRSVYPDFRGTYEQNLWLLTLGAAKQADPSVGIKNCTSYAREAKEKGVMFLQPYPRIEDTRLCSPSHYLHYIVRYDQPKVNALLAGAYRCSARLNAKYLTKALRLHEVYSALPETRSRRFDEDEDEDKPRPPPSAADIKLRLMRRQALNACVKAQMMLTADNLDEYKIIAYGWTHLRKQAPVAKSTCAAAQALAAIDTLIQARGY